MAYAEAELRRTIELEPQFSEAHYTLGLIYTEAGDTAKAVEQLRTAVQQRPDYAEAWFALGSTLRSTGDLNGGHRSAAALDRAQQPERRSIQHSRPYPSPEGRCGRGERRRLRGLRMSERRTSSRKASCCGRVRRAVKSNPYLVFISGSTLKNSLQYAAPTLNK